MAIDLRSIHDLEQDALYLLPLGIGNAFTRRYYNSSFLLICGGRSLLVDAPAPLRHILARAEKLSGIALDLDNVDTIFLTHLHGDHCNGLEELGFFRMFSEGLPLPRLILHDKLRSKLWHQKLYASMGELAMPDGAIQMMELESYFDVTTFHEGNELDSGIPGLKITPCPTSHLVPTWGFKAEYEGRRLGYSADTAFDPELIRFFSDCHVIIHETGPGIGHTPLESLLELPADVRERIMLIDIPDDLDARHSPIPVLEEGRLYNVFA